MGDIIVLETTPTGRSISFTLETKGSLMKYTFVANVILNMYTNQTHFFFSYFWHN